MIYFAAEEIYTSVLYAIIYGFVFAIISRLSRLLIEEIRLARHLVTAVIRYEKIFDPPIALKYSAEKCKLDGMSGRIFKFCEILTFGIGYILLSYLALDGLHRVYILIISLIAYFLAERLISVTLLKALILIIELIMTLIVYIFRILLKPIIKIHSYFAEKTINIRKKLPK